jgi:hypothetical protein
MLLGFRSKFTAQSAQPLRLSWIDPNELEYWAKSPFILNLLRCLREGNSNRLSPFVVGGHWDEELVALSEMDSHFAFYQRYARIKDWRDTAYFQRISKNFRVGLKKGKFRTVEEWEQSILWRYDRIFSVIQSNGYKTQAELNGQYGLLDEIAVCVSRAGRLLFLNGKHRLAMAKALNLEKIPVVIVAIHRVWNDSCGDTDPVVEGDK